MARFVCDRCSFDYPYSSRREEWTGSIVCPTCYDEKHPQLTLPLTRPDGMGLPDARAETVLATTGDASWTINQTTFTKTGSPR